MKLVGWEQIENFCGAHVHRPSRTHVMTLIQLGLLEKRLNVRNRVVIDSDALEAAQQTFDKSIVLAADRGIHCRSPLALARAGLHAGGLVLNSRPARRARKAAVVEDRQRQLALVLPVAR